jgi:hypothetical protein
MNIFCLDQDPKKAARYLCDAHVIKMIVESAQMLANCFTLERLAADDCPRNSSGNARSHGYSNHPCTRWAMESSSNMNWLILHALSMCHEKKRRYGGGHFSESFIRWCDLRYNDSLVPLGGLTDFAIAISDQQQCRKHQGFDGLTAVEKYRLYYIYDKSSFAKWKFCSPPKWFTAGLGRLSLKQKGGAQ